MTVRKAAFGLLMWTLVGVVAVEGSMILSLRSEAQAARSRVAALTDGLPRDSGDLDTLNQRILGVEAELRGLAGNVSQLIESATQPEAPPVDVSDINARLAVLEDMTCRVALAAVQYSTVAQAMCQKLGAGSRWGYEAPAP